MLKVVRNLEKLGKNDNKLLTYFIVYAKIF